MTPDGIPRRWRQPVPWIWLAAMALGLWLCARASYVADLSAFLPSSPTAEQRVLSFPPRTTDAAPRPVSRAPRPALGWMLTAAAAGLVVGVGTGHGIYLEWPPREPAPQIRTATAPGPQAAPVDAVENDDAILGEVETALASRGVEELQPLDALTPRVTLVASR